MGECKTKAIQTNLGIFMHNQTYPAIIQAYSGIEPWHIHNPGIFRTLLHSECWHIQNLRHIQIYAMQLW